MGKVDVAKFLEHCDHCREPFWSYYNDPETLCDTCAALREVEEREALLYDDD